MEHASVAAFARFPLQLLALGAPADLVTLTQQATADETHHARMCFALASAYRGEALGPDALDMQRALEGTSLEDVLALVVREGMIGETTAAVEAREGLAHATDPVVRAVLEQNCAGRDAACRARLALRHLGHRNPWRRGATGDPHRARCSTPTHASSAR